VEQATTDTDGSQGFAATLRAGVAARENKWTYNARGQVLTHDGPRTDVNDVTTYAYYTDTTADHTIGDLQSATNAVGHVTQYTIYDAEGRLKRTVAPNGVITETTYTPRGWVSSVTTTAGAAAPQTVAYTHEIDGRPATVTLPDGTTLTYAYDSGRRLTGITDGSGNSVTYTLDTAGNRIAEQYKDSSGTLARDVSRAYDALGRVMTISGAAQ
jgi:YD repeat-containing protein